MDWAAQQTGAAASVRERQLEVAVWGSGDCISAATPSTPNPATPQRKLRGRKRSGKFSGCRLFEGSKLRRICREGNRPQSLEVASLLKLVAGDVLFSAFGNEGLDSAGSAMPAVDRPSDFPARNFFCQR